MYDYAVADGERNIVLWGISMGAATIIKAMHDFASVQPSRVILEMPFGTMYDAVKGRLRFMEVPQEPLAILLTFWGGTELGIWAFSNKPEEYAKSISCPALLEWGAEDPRVSRTETENIFKNLSSKEKTYAEYKNAGHESLCKNDHAVWMQYVTSFLK